MRPPDSANCQFYCNLVYGNRDALTVWSPTGQTNFVFNNTLLSDRYVVIADHGVLCLTNNILIGLHQDQVLCAEEGATIQADYNLTPVRGTQSGAHDLVVADPGFVRPAAGLFWLRQDSPAWGSAAQGIALPADFFGMKRSRVLSMGAFQFGAQLIGDKRVLDPSPARPDYWLADPTASHSRLQRDRYGLHELCAN